MPINRAAIARAIANRWRWSPDIDDFRQEAVIATWLNRATPDLYFARAIRFHLIDYLRRTGPIKRGGTPRRVALDISGMDIPSKINSALRMEDRVYITQLMASLSQRERVIIRGIYWQGAYQKEIAKRLRISRARVSAIHQVALRKMRKVR